MTRLILVPPPDLEKHCGLPSKVNWGAFRSPEGRVLLGESARKIRELCDELGLMTRAGRRMWNVMGLTAKSA